MKYLSFDYEMRLSYSEEAAATYYTLKCLPMDSLRQQVEALSVEILPETSPSYGADGFGNRTVYGVCEKPHGAFSFRVSGIVRTGLSDAEEDVDDSAVMIFRAPHGLNAAGEKIRAYYDGLVDDTFTDTLDTALFLMHALHRDFRYEKGVTGVDTSAEEAFQRGAGVCQDFAHIFIALLHLSHIPARYVTGMVIGEGASHAWVEIAADGKWIGLDPTNDMLVGADHIRIGIGRDAKDCAINRGIVKGPGTQTQSVNVIVKEIEE